MMVSGAVLTIVLEQSPSTDTSTLGEVLPSSGLCFVLTIDLKENVLNRIVVQPDIGENQQRVGARTAALTIKLNTVSNIEMINLHQQASEIIVRILLDSLAGNKKMQAMLEEVSE